MNPSASEPHPAARDPVVLRMVGIRKAFPGVVALDGVDLEVRAGEVHVLLGENGAGKSTLMKVLSGAHAMDAGRIELAGSDVEISGPRHARDLGIGIIYQELALVPDLSAAENVFLGREPRRGPGLVDRGAMVAASRRILETLGATFDPGLPVRVLSIAQRQLVEVARALSLDARILVMDEPTSALTDREADRLFALVRDLRSRGIGIVYISHRLEEVAALADRVSVLRDGELIATRPAAETGRAELIRLMVGRDLQAVFPKRTVPIGNIALETDRIGCHAVGVRDVSLEVRAGEVLGLAGLVGAGRTELARVLFGIDPADQGVMRLRGSPVTVWSPAQAVRLGLAYLPEDRRRHGVIPEMSVAANTTLASLRAIARGGFLDHRAEQTVAASYVKRLSIKARSIDAPVSELSGGNQQKVALARWLATGPRVLILDEPTQGVDVAAKVEIHTHIVDLAAEGLAILLISSELPEVLGMSDRIAVMRAGTVVGTLDRKDTTQETIMALALGTPR